MKKTGTTNSTSLQWNKSTSTFVLIPHSAVVLEIYKKNYWQKLR